MTLLLNAAGNVIVAIPGNKERNALFIQQKFSLQYIYTALIEYYVQKVSTLLGWLHGRGG
jgi:hypothetical protein